MKRDSFGAFISVILFFIPAMSFAGEYVSYQPGHPARDAMGYVLIDEAGGGEFMNGALENPPDMPGWPLNISLYPPEEGGLFVQGDADAEMEVLFSTGKTVHLVDTDGSYLSGWPKFISTGTDVSGGPAFGDVDGDGEGEVVVTSCNWPNGDDGWVYAYRTDGDLVEGFPATTNGDFSKSPTVVDLDDDGHAEIIVGERDYPIGRVYVIGGDGSILPGWPVELDHVPASSAGAADIDNDGIMEILYESYNTIYAFNIDGTLVSGWPFTPATGDVFSYSAPVFADVDSDGFLEIAVGGHSLSGDSGVFILNHDGSLLPGWPQFVNYWIYAPPTFADMDGDDDFELLVGDQVLSAEPVDHVYAWHMDGTSVAGWPVGPINAVNAQVAVADIDGDNDPEFVWDDNTGAGIILGYHHNGQPIEGWPLNTQGTTFFNTVAFADADIDGDLELLAESGDFSNENSHIYLWDLQDQTSDQRIQMPMFQYGPGRDGLYRYFGEMPTPAPTVEITETPVPPSPTQTSTPTPTNTFCLPTFTPTPTFSPTDPPATPTRTPTQTLSPTPSLTPSFTPTIAFTSTPVSPTPSETPILPTYTPQCSELGVTIHMPDTFYSPGEQCWCSVTLCNPGAQDFQDVPLFVILDVWGILFFAPEFDEFGYYLVDLDPGSTEKNILDPFEWPGNCGNADGIVFYAGMTDDQMTELFGTADEWSFGWAE